MSQHILSNFQLPFEESEMSLITRAGVGGVEQLKSLVILLTRSWKYKVVFINNPSFIDLFALFVAKTYSRKTLFIAFDLILKRPRSPIELAVAKTKGLLINCFDKVIAIHKDTSGYELCYGLRSGLFTYIPFKSNNFNEGGDYVIEDHQYIVSLGASQRDYATLARAVEGLPIEVKIVCSRDAALRHNALLPEIIPENVTLVDDFVSKEAWNELIAKSSFVVIPICEGVIQPAGVSVYLEAMTLEKAVIISDGASSKGLIDDLALLVPEGDCAALSAAITQLLSDNELRARLAKKGKLYADALAGEQRLKKDIKQYLSSLLVN